jgi:hypothetical protein
MQLKPLKNTGFLKEPGWQSGGSAVVIHGVEVVMIPFPDLFPEIKSILVS